jgi:ribosomal protein S19
MSRSIWKGFYIDPRVITRILVHNNNNNNNDNNILTRSRSSTILDAIRNVLFYVHMGNGYRKVIVLPIRLGRKLGEFTRTRLKFYEPRNKKKINKKKLNGKKNK